VREVEKKRVREEEEGKEGEAFFGSNRILILRFARFICN
jgi:hypothetical protein